MDSVFFNTEDIAKINKNNILYLKDIASKSSRKTSRICLHKSTDDLLQEMVIVLNKDGYRRPHKHIDRSETICIIEGRLFLIIFDDEGKVKNKIFMDKDSDKGNIMCRLEKNIWHMVIPITEDVVFFEITKGPFDRKNNISALWAPLEGETDKIDIFLKSLLNE